MDTYRYRDRFGFLLSFGGRLFVEACLLILPLPFLYWFIGCFGHRYDAQDKNKNESRKSEHRKEKVPFGRYVFTNFFIGSMYDFFKIFIYRVDLLA